MTQNKKTNGRAKSGAGPTVPTIPGPVRFAFRSLDTLSSTLAGRLAARLFLTTRRHRVPERETRVLADAARRELMTDRGSAVAWIWGEPDPPPSAADGPPSTVYLLHGWEGRGAQLGAFVDPLRAAGLRVVAMDAPGHGEAPGRSSSLVHLGATLEAAVARWGPAVGVVAHSAGAVGTTWALGRGLAAGRVVFVTPGTDLRRYTGGFAHLLGLGATARRELEATIVRRIGVPFEAIEPLEQAPEREAPLLVFADRDDREAPVAGAERLVAAWPGARLVVTEGLGHRRILRDRAVVTEAVEFLTGKAAHRGAAGELEPRSAPVLAEAAS